MSFEPNSNGTSAQPGAPIPSSQMSAVPAEGGNADEELLVAYLDGELDAESVSHVETKLAKDPTYRQSLNDLRAAWDLLEELPAVELNPTFAQSTIEMVAMKAGPFSKNRIIKRLGWRLMAACLLAVPVMFALGYIGMRAYQRFTERHAIDDVHILADWDALKAVESFEWLQELRKVNYLVQVAKRPTSSELGVGIVPKSLNERRKWIQELDPSDRDRLSANLLAFKHAPAGARQRIVDLAQRIHASPDAEANLQVARSYVYFLSEMSISDRTAHLDETNDHETRLNDLRRRVNRRLVDVYTENLTPESSDFVAVKRWIKQMQETYNGSLPHNSVLDDLDRRNTFGDSVIDENDLDNLLQSLTPEAQTILGRLQTKELQHAALILYFVNKAQPDYQSFGTQRAMDRAKLTERFKQLPDNRRSELEFLPPETAQRWLGMQ